MRGIEIDVRPRHAHRPPRARRAGSKPSAASWSIERRGAAASLDEPRAVDLDHRVPNGAPGQMNGAAREHTRLRALDIDLHQVDAPDAPVVQAVVEPPHRNFDGRPLGPRQQRRVVIAAALGARDVQRDRSVALGQAPVAGFDVCDRIRRQVRSQRREYNGVGLDRDHASVASDAVGRNQREIAGVRPDVEERPAGAEQGLRPASHRVRETPHVDLPMNRIREVQRS